MSTVGRCRKPLPASFSTNQRMRLRSSTASSRGHGRYGSLTRKETRPGACSGRKFDSASCSTLTKPEFWLATRVGRTSGQLFRKAKGFRRSLMRSGLCGRHGSTSLRGTEHSTFSAESATALTERRSSTGIAEALGCPVDQAEAIVWALGLTKEDDGRWVLTGDAAAELLWQSILLIKDLGRAPSEEQIRALLPPTDEE